MGSTPFSSREMTLSQKLQETVQWRYDAQEGIWREAYIWWNPLQIADVLKYYVNINASDWPEPSNTDYKALEHRHHRKIAEMAVSFMQDIRYLFQMPKLQLPAGNLIRIKLAATFIAFLHQLLCRRSFSFNSRFIEDGINALADKELGFLFTVLADKSLWLVELEQTQSLLAEFEAVANDAGDFVHSVLFAGKLRSESIEKPLDALLKSIHRLKENVIKFSNELPFISNSAMIAETTVSEGCSYIVDSILCDLKNLLMQDDAGLPVTLKETIRILHQQLMHSQTMLDSIKAPPLSSNQFKETRTRLRDVVSEAEYLINSFLVGNVPLPYLIIRLSQVIHRTRIIGTMLQEIRKNYEIGDLKVADDASVRISFPAESVSEVDDIVIGFEENAEYILDQLVGGREQLQIIAITGMPGIGKTTFAKKLYNHPCVTYRFDKLSWCVVSHTYHKKKLLVDVFKSLTGKHDKVAISNMEEHNLVESIYKSLKGRRYLIVMDDIWDSSAWDEVWMCFPDDGNGSRILLTTRDTNVVPTGGIIHALPMLSSEQCWELLKTKVFQNKKCPPELQENGKKIAQNCCGLPLAVVVVAGVLSTLDIDEIAWNEVGGKLGSYIFDGGDRFMMSIAELSYQHLSEYLKPCFLSFGVFDEGFIVSTTYVMRTWIAEGFIAKKEGKSAESVAEEYLKELVDKSLIIVYEKRSDDGVKTCVMHDLLHELCLEKSKGENFVKWVRQNHLICEEGHLLPLAGPSGHGPHSSSSFNQQKSPLFHILNLTSLRVLHTTILSSNHCWIGVHLLVNLRCLIIDIIPATIDRLVNLEFLLVHFRIQISGPILKLPKLRHLHATKGLKYAEDCNSSQVNKLEYLSKLEIYSLKDEEMLRSTWPNLRKLNCRCKSLWDEEKGTYRYPDLGFLTQLEKLRMNTWRSQNREAEISFPSNIRKLTLGYLELPRERMRIIGGLPKLEVLKLRESSFVGETWETRDGEFQQLRHLELSDLDLAEWNVDSTQHFPKLQRLILAWCNNLKEIPCEFGQIPTLQLIELYCCGKGVEESAIQIEGEQRDNGNEDLSVIMG